MTAKIGGPVYVAGDFVNVDALLSSEDFRKRRGGCTVVVAGDGFGQGARDAGDAERLRAAGVRAVVAESYAPEFRNASDTGEALCAVESAYRLLDGFETGDCVEIDLHRLHLRDANGSAAYPLKQRMRDGNGKESG